MTQLENLKSEPNDLDTKGFLGFPRWKDLDSLEADIAILGVPIATPYPALDAYAEGAPGAIRAGIERYALSAHHFDFDVGGLLLGDGGTCVVDCGDVPGDSEDAEGNRARISGAIQAILKAGAVPIVIGGNDSVPIPVFQAFDGRGPLTILQVDAHIDWRDEVGGERYGLSSPMRRSSEMPWIEHIVQVGARAIGSARQSDYEDACAWGAHIVTAQQVHVHGIQPILDLVPNGANVLVTVDCDGLDPSIMPAVFGPAPGGLTYWQVVDLLQGTATKAQIACFNIVEFMPARDPQGIAALTAARLVCNAIALLARARRAAILPKVKQI